MMDGRELPPITGSELRIVLGAGRLTRIIQRVPNRYFSS
jgi:hypothetical protein